MTKTQARRDRLTYKDYNLIFVVFEFLTIYIYWEWWYEEVGRTALSERHLSN